MQLLFCEALKETELMNHTRLFSVHSVWSYLHSIANQSFLTCHWGKIPLTFWEVDEIFEIQSSARTCFRKRSENEYYFSEIESFTNRYLFCSVRLLLDSVPLLQLGIYMNKKPKQFWLWVALVFGLDWPDHCSPFISTPHKN